MYFTCRACGLGQHGVDARLGIEGGQTRQAQRLLCLAGASWSFQKASENLKEFCGLKVCANTVRSVCQQEAPRIEAWQATAAASEKYRKSPGLDEFQTDGTCVNTEQGWKEMRVGVFAKRAAGAAASADEWATRAVPSPGPRVAFAAIEDHDTFAARWPAVAARLGIRANAALDVWADGAKWIWERINFHFAFARGTLDIFHALEHVSAAAKAQFGEATSQAQQWQDEARTALLTQGHAGITHLIEETRLVAVRAPQRTALTELANYLTPHAKRLNYAERLATGRPIGSGMIEGACKNYLGRRLKQTGARWRIPNANRMATLASLLYSKNWNQYWN